MMSNLYAEQGDIPRANDYYIRAKCIPNVPSSRLFYCTLALAKAYASNDDYDKGKRKKNYPFLYIFLLFVLETYMYVSSVLKSAISSQKPCQNVLI
jgi:hypothetical protein